MQLVQGLLCEALTVWADEGISIPPKAVFLEHSLVGKGPLVKPVCTLLIPLLHLRQKFCS